MTKTTTTKREWAAPAVRRIDAQAAQGSGFTVQQDNLLNQGS